MSRRATLKASDADRERVAERLRHATAEGRLNPEELEERLEMVFAARTYGELDPLVADLPGEAVRRREHPGRVSASFWLRPAPLLALFILAPVILALMLAAAVIIATVFSAWGLLLVVGWLAFGHGRGHPRYGASYRRSLHAATRWQPGRAPRPRSWV